MSKNQITREDIISLKELNWCRDHAETVKKAIKANKKLHKSIIQLQIKVLKFKLNSI